MLGTGTGQREEVLERLWVQIIFLLTELAVSVAPKPDASGICAKRWKCVRLFTAIPFLLECCAVLGEVVHVEQTGLGFILLFSAESQLNLRRGVCPPLTLVRTKRTDFVQRL